LGTEKLELGVKTMFNIGDQVIYPGYGAGIVDGVKKLSSLGGSKLYYSIDLSDETKTRIWVPVVDAVKRGVRYLTPLSQLDQIWRVLRSDPAALSPDHDTRHALLKEKLRGGDVLQVAEVVRDMFWEDHRSTKLTALGQGFYDRGLMLLTSEIAAVQGCGFATAKTEISDILGTSLAAGSQV
jgi:CarD family transcriptional regulator